MTSLWPISFLRSTRPSRHSLPTAKSSLRSGLPRPYIQGWGFWSRILVRFCRIILAAAMYAGTTCSLNVVGFFCFFCSLQLLLCAGPSPAPPTRWPSSTRSTPWRSSWTPLACASTTRSSWPATPTPPTATVSTRSGSWSGPERRRSSSAVGLPYHCHKPASASVCYPPPIPETTTSTSPGHHLHFWDFPVKKSPCCVLFFFVFLPKFRFIYLDTQFNDRKRTDSIPLHLHRGCCFSFF